MTIKCPHCGSTAQVKQTYLPTLSDNGQVVTEGFVCGCGCHFAHEYQRNDDGFWEISWCDVEYIEKK